MAPDADIAEKDPLWMGTSYHIRIGKLASGDRLSVW